MKLKKTFIVNHVGGETIAVPVSGSFHGVVKANDTGAFILECLKKETSPEAIADRLVEEYDVEREKALADVGRLIETLREIDVLDE